MGAQVSSAEGKPKAADAEHKPPITPPSTVVKTTPTTLAAPKAVSKDNHLILESPGTHVVSVGKETGPNTIESKSQLQVEVTKERDAKLLDSEGEEEGGPAETKGQALPVAQKLPVALPQKPLEPSHVQKKKPKLAKKAAKRKHVAHPSVVHKCTPIMPHLFGLELRISASIILRQYTSAEWLDFYRLAAYCASCMIPLSYFNET